MTIKTANLTYPKFPSAPFFELTQRKSQRLTLTAEADILFNFSPLNFIFATMFPFNLLSIVYGQAQLKLQLNLI